MGTQIRIRIRTTTIATTATSQTAPNRPATNPITPRLNPITTNARTATQTQPSAATTLIARTRGPKETGKQMETETSPIGSHTRETRHTSARGSNAGTT